MTPEKAFGEVLFELRRERKLSQEKLAEMSKCTRPYISYLETGRSSPSLNMILNISDALGVQPTEIISRVLSKMSETRSREN